MKKNWMIGVLVAILAVVLSACNNTPDYVGKYKFTGTAEIDMDGRKTLSTVAGTFDLSQTGNTVTFSGDLNGVGTVNGDVVTIEPTHVEQTLPNGFKQTTDNTVEPITLSGSSLHIVSNTVVVQEMDGQKSRTSAHEEYVAVKQ